MWEEITKNSCHPAAWRCSCSFYDRDHDCYSTKRRHSATDGDTMSNTNWIKSCDKKNKINDGVLQHTIQKTKRKNKNKTKIKQIQIQKRYQKRKRKWKQKRKKNRNLKETSGSAQWSFITWLITLRRTSITASVANGMISITISSSSSIKKLRDIDTEFPWSKINGSLGSNIYNRSIICFTYSILKWNKLFPFVILCSFGWTFGWSSCFWLRNKVSNFFIYYFHRWIRWTNRLIWQWRWQCQRQWRRRCRCVIRLTIMGHYMNGGWVWMQVLVWIRCFDQLIIMVEWRRLWMQVLMWIRCVDWYISTSAILLLLLWRWCQRCQQQCWQWWSRHIRISNIRKRKKKEEGRK